MIRHYGRVVKATDSNFSISMDPTSVFFGSAGSNPAGVDFVSRNNFFWRHGFEMCMHHVWKKSFSPSLSIKLTSFLLLFTLNHHTTS